MDLLTYILSIKSFRIQIVFVFTVIKLLPLYYTIRIRKLSTNFYDSILNSPKKPIFTIPHDIKLFLMHLTATHIYKKQTRLPHYDLINPQPTIVKSELYRTRVTQRPRAQLIAHENRRRHRFRLARATCPR